MLVKWAFVRSFRFVDNVDRK